MFKGFTKEFQSRLENYNRNSEQFLFNFSDLEPNYDEENQFDITSTQLREEIGKIAGSKERNESYPRAFSFAQVPKKIVLSKQSFFLWFMISKKLLSKLVNASEKRVIKLPNEETSKGEELFRIRPSARSLFFIIEKEPDGKRDADKVEEILGSENECAEQVKEKVNNARASSLQKIEQVISQSKADIEELEINYVDILPTYCGCEVGVYNNNHYLYKNHLNNCL